MSSGNTLTSVSVLIGLSSRGIRLLHDDQLTKTMVAVPCFVLFGIHVGILEEYCAILSVG